MYSYIYIGIIGTGDGYAVSSKGPMAIEGDHQWKLKDEIDRTWMLGTYIDTYSFILIRPLTQLFTHIHTHTSPYILTYSYMHMQDTKSCQTKLR